MIKILLVDDHPLVIEGLRAIIKPLNNITLIESVTNGKDALLFLKKNTIDIILLDINLPDVSGIELCKIIKKKHPDTKILALSVFNERSYVMQMLNNGALGYVLKNITGQELEMAIVETYNGKTFLSEQLQSGMLNSAIECTKNIVPKLTSREKEILPLIAEGLTNKEIGDKLFISNLTVISHRKNLLLKFDAGNTAVLIREAINYGLL